VPLLRYLERNAWALPLGIVILAVFGAVFAPWFAPQNPNDPGQLHLEDSYLSPAWLRGAAPAALQDRNPSYLLGTDGQGRDILSAVFFGLRVSLLVGVAGTLLALGTGVALGLVAGHRGGRWDAAIMRVADIQLSFPSILIAIFLMAIWGQGLAKIIIAVGLVHWVIYARVVRGGVLSEREKDYISAITAIGARPMRILFRHLLPNLTGPLIVVSAVQFASIVMLEATLSYLGLGVPITRPSLGMLIKFGYDDFFSGYWWVWFFPGLALLILVMSVNWLADLLRYRMAAGG
jgi:peptide/nickel transport system permease protein